LAEWREEVKDHRAHFETARRERGTTLRWSARTAAA